MPKDGKASGTHAAQQRLHRAVIRQTIVLATGAFGLVAALAWNDAVRALFDQIFGTQGSGIAAKFGYAAVVTVIVVAVSVRLQRAVQSK